MFEATLVELTKRDEVEPIVSQWIRERGTCMDGASYAAALELAAYVAASRTTPDREAIRDAAFEQCAQLVDRMAKQKHDRGADDALVRSIAARIRALKTIPTSDKGGA
ncbi:hypothetical protein KTE13_00040 [Burkholderia multivorans]|nr:hypothetical protein [Burkholderia multivorans]